MRCACWILATFLIGGCAAQRPGNSSQAEAPIPEAELACARALAFDPILPGGTPMLDLSRDLRQPAAYGGFDNQTFSTYQIYVNDRQRIFSDRNGLEYQRNTYTWRTGTSYR